MDVITVWECVACECRGPAPDKVRHLLTCTQRDELRRLTFPLSDGPAAPLF